MAKIERCERCDEVIEERFQHTCQPPTTDAMGELRRRIRALEGKIARVKR